VTPPLRLGSASLLIVAASAVLAAPAPAGEFRTAANAACGRYDRTTANLPGITSAAELKRQLVLVPRLFRAMVDRIAATPAPQAQRAMATELVASLRRVQRILGQIRDAFLRGDKPGIDAAVRSGAAPSRAAARAARALGLPTCAHLAASAAKGPQP
jgi:hypothetical protein